MEQTTTSNENIKLLIQATTQMKSQKNYAEWKKPSKKQYIVYDYIYIKYRKCKLIYSERKQITDCTQKLGRKKARSRITKGYEETLGGDGWARYFDYGDGFMGMYVCVYMSKLIKLYLLNMCNLLHADYTLIKLLEKD